MTALPTEILAAPETSLDMKAIRLDQYFLTTKWSKKSISAALM